MRPGTAANANGNSSPARLEKSPQALRPLATLKEQPRRSARFRRIRQAFAGGIARRRRRHPAPLELYCCLLQTAGGHRPPHALIRQQKLSHREPAGPPSKADERNPAGAREAPVYCSAVGSEFVMSNERP